MSSNRLHLSGLLIGALCAASLATIGLGLERSVFADEFPVQTGIDTSRLVKFETRDYRVERADWVDTTPIRSTTVKKIEAGMVSYVTIATTSTGTYSSDAMFSRNVQYPGITVTPQPQVFNSFAYWSGDDWTGFRVSNGDSFRYYRFNRN